VHLAALTPPAAEKLHGRLVSVWVQVGKVPVTTDDGRTLIGPADTDDVERVVILKGERLDVNPGDRLVVAGKLRVIRHAAHRVHVVVVDGGEEIRFEE